MLRLPRLHSGIDSWTLNWCGYTRCLRLWKPSMWKARRERGLRLWQYEEYGDVG
jgi:hypothetical protein